MGVNILKETVTDTKVYVLSEWKEGVIRDQQTFCVKVKTVTILGFV